MPTVKFRPLDFSQAILDHGIEVFWEKARICSCYKSEASESKAVCPLCNGLHYTWDPQGIIPILATGIKELKNSTMDWTTLRQGDMSVTTLPEHRLALNDRLRQVHSPETYQETLTYKVLDGRRVFEPYYEVYSLEAAYDTAGQSIDPSRLIYSQLDGTLTVQDYADDTISLRYTHLPSLLICDLLHTNRQQWTGETGYGELQRLPNQATARRITSKLNTPFKPGMTQLGLISEAIPPLNPLSYSVYTANYTQAVSNSFDFAWLGNETHEVARFEDADSIHINGLSVLTDETVLEDFAPALSLVDYPQTYLWMPSKYSCPKRFVDVPYGAILSLHEDSTFKATLPNGPVHFITEYDFDTNPDCEVLIPNEKSFTFYPREAAWHPTSLPIVFSVSSQHTLEITYGDATLDTHLPASPHVNYLTICMDNNTYFGRFKIFFNGVFYQTGKLLDPQVRGTLSNKMLTSQADLILFRHYTGYLDIFSHNQNRLTHTLDLIPTVGPTPAEDAIYELTDVFNIYCQA